MLDILRAINRSSARIFVGGVSDWLTTIPGSRAALNLVDLILFFPDVFYRPINLINDIVVTGGYQIRFKRKSEFFGSTGINECNFVSNPCFLDDFPATLLGRNTLAIG